MPETVDPAWSYDTASGELIMNVYEPLIFYDVDKTLDQKAQGLTEDFEARLAVDYEIEEIDEVSPHGISWSYRYTFDIRGQDPTPVVIHNIVPVYLPDWVCTYWCTGERELVLTILAPGPNPPSPVSSIATDGVDTYHIEKWWDDNHDHDFSVCDYVRVKNLNTGEVRVWGVCGIAGPVVTLCITKMHLESWHDNDLNGMLTPTDQLDFWYRAPKSGMSVKRWYHVVDVIYMDPMHVTITMVEEQVYWQNGAVLTTGDVEYSIERILVQDRSGGPEWMWYYPMFGSYHAPSWTATYPSRTLIEFIARIDDAVQRSATQVVFNFMTLLGPPLSQLQIITQTWGSILNEAWCAADSRDWNGLYEEPLHFKGDCDTDGVVGGLDSGTIGYYWGGSKGTPGYHVSGDVDRDAVIGGLDSGIVGYYWGATASPDGKGWYRYHNPTKSPLDDPTPRMMGTGPYKLFAISYIAKFWRLVAFKDVKPVTYWGMWPSHFSTPSMGYQGYLDAVTHYVVDEWLDRRTAFLACDYDFCYVPREYIGQVAGQPNVECIFPLETLAVDALFFTFELPENTPYAGGSGGHGYPADEFHLDGIPINFFGDVHIRKAFAYAFNYTEYIEEVYLGEAVHPSTPLVVGLGPKSPINIPVLIRDGGTLGNTTYLPPISVWPNDLDKMVEEFKLAFGGTLLDPGDAWDIGFTFTMTYNTGSVGRLRVCQSIKEDVEANHPRATINIQEVDWDTYLADMVNSPYYVAKMPLWMLGWLADYPDVYNFAGPFMFSEGDFSVFQAYYLDPSSIEMDEILAASIGPEALADPDVRAGLYWEACKLYQDNMVNLPTIQGTGRHWQKTWVEGWYYNPVYPGDYFYHLWKEMP